MNSAAKIHHFAVKQYAFMKTFTAQCSTVVFGIYVLTFFSPSLFFLRQLSEENANLQVHVEKESNEKKRLSRTNEELLWRLQTGELSPRMSPSSSPIHRPSSGPGSPARPHSYHQWLSQRKHLYQTLSFNLALEAAILKKNHSFLNVPVS